VISEVLWMGSDVSTADEWLEIAGYEGESGSTSLANWTVTALDSSGNEVILHRFGTGEVLTDGEFGILSHYPASASRLASEPRWVDKNVSLLNTKLLLRLRDASGAIIDEVDDGVGAPFAGANPSGGGPKASMERVDLSQPGNVASNWVTAAQSFGFKSGGAIFGTPGSGYSSIQSGESSNSLISSEPSIEPNSSSLSSEFSSSDSLDTSSYSSGVSVSSSSFESVSSLASSPAIRITEILPDAVGSDDASWIELGNLGDESVDIAGWTIAVSSHQFVIPSTTASGFLIAPDEYVSFRRTQTGLSFPHAGAAVTIHQGNKVRDTLLYPKMLEGTSNIRTHGQRRRGRANCHHSRQSWIASRI
jgi:hypothetical protein